MFARHYYSLALFSLADPLDKGNSLSHGVDLPGVAFQVPISPPRLLTKPFKSQNHHHPSYGALPLCAAWLILMGLSSHLPNGVPLTTKLQFHGPRPHNFRSVVREF